MSVRSLAPLRLVTLVAGGAALVSWAIALGQAMPRLLAGPLCSSRTDAFSFAGHCPACYVAVACSLAFLAALAMDARGRFFPRPQVAAQIVR